MRDLALAVALGAVVAIPARALPHPEDPIDPEKRASVSTADAVRPSATPPTGTGVVGTGKIPGKRAPIALVSKDKPGAPIVVTESRSKAVKRYGKQVPQSRKDLRSTSASARAASIPRIDSHRFSTALAAYRQGKTTAPSLANFDVRIGTKTADMGVINRYASPRATLEAQGIPVVSAGAAAPPEASSAPVPLKSPDATPSPAP